MRRAATVVGLVCAFGVGGCGGDESIIGMQEQAGTQIDSSGLRAAVGIPGITPHLQFLEGNGARPAGSPAYDAALTYFEGKLKAAGFVTTWQPFLYDEYVQHAPSTLAQTSPNSKTYASGAAPYKLGYDIGGVEYSASGTVSALIQPTNDIVEPPGPTAGSSNSGCEAADFPASTSGKIALVQRGTCTFFVKVQNAEAAGAVGVILYNEGQPGRTATSFFTLEKPVTIPVLMVSYAVGAELYALAQSGPVSVTMTVSGQTNLKQQSKNLYAETVGGRSDRLVLAGAHLDSAAEGTGINDNGSGAATLLAIAEQMKALGITPRNKVRFAFWGAEENGLIGSEFYASQLTAAELKQHQVYLNFDMLASANYALMVYDGDASEGVEGWTSGPNGSGNVETILKDYFTAQQLTTFPCGLDGRSDYLGFADRKIPVGGLFTGADEVKTAEQAALYGGTAGVLLDPNYHTANDTLANANTTALDIMSDATAHAVLTFAMTTSAVTGTSQSSPKATKPPIYKGPHMVR